MIEHVYFGLYLNFPTVSGTCRLLGSGKYLCPRTVSMHGEIHVLAILPYNHISLNTIEIYSYFGTYKYTQHQLLNIT